MGECLACVDGSIQLVGGQVDARLENEEERLEDGVTG